MANKRFPHERYASIELNQVAFPQTGMVVSQTPLGDEFTTEKPCENGMWLNVDKSKGKLSAPKAATDVIGVVYTAEKEYDRSGYGLKNFAGRIAGQYPRVGILGLGDTITSNCFQYDDTDFSTESALFTALAAYATTPVYVTAVTGEAVPKLTNTAPTEGTYGVVTKFYTMPNGEPGVKYQIVAVQKPAAGE